MVIKMTQIKLTSKHSVNRGLINPFSAKEMILWLVSSWILASCQPHRIVRGQLHYGYRFLPESGRKYKLFKNIHRENFGQRHYMWHYWMDFAYCVRTWHYEGREKVKESGTLHTVATPVSYTHLTLPTSVYV